MEDNEVDTGVFYCLQLPVHFFRLHVSVPEPEGDQIRRGSSELLRLYSLIRRR
jgi:hypothetical protein